MLQVVAPSPVILPQFSSAPLLHFYFYCLLRRSVRRLTTQEREYAMISTNEAVVRECWLEANEARCAFRRSIPADTTNATGRCRNGG